MGIHNDTISKLTNHVRVFKDNIEIDDTIINVPPIRIQTRNIIISFMYDYYYDINTGIDHIRIAAINWLKRKGD
jgi:hypothetical protein